MQNYITPHHTTPHYTTLHYTTPHYTTPHHTTPHHNITPHYNITRHNTTRHARHDLNKNVKVRRHDASSCLFRVIREACRKTKSDRLPGLQFCGRALSKVERPRLLLQTQKRNAVRLQQDVCLLRYVRWNVGVIYYIV